MNATVLVSFNQRILVIDFPVKFLIGEVIGVNLVLVGEVLQVTVTGSIANGTVNGVFQEQELENQFPGFHNLVGHGADDHPFRYRCSTGRDQAPLHLLNFHQTHTAATEWMQLLVMTEYRYSDAGSFGCIINGCIALYRYLFVVYSKINHLDLCSPSEFLR